MIGLGIYDWDSNLLKCNNCNFIFGLSFRFVPYLTVHVTLCVRSSLVSFLRFDISASGIMFFLFFLFYIFCCMCSTTFATSNSFSFNGLSRYFLSVIDVIGFDTGNSVLKSGKLHYYFRSISLSQRSSVVSVAVCLAQKIPLELYLFLFGK